MKNRDQIDVAMREATKFDVKDTDGRYENVTVGNKAQRRQQAKASRKPRKMRKNF